MKIEEAVSQKEFFNEWHKLRVNLLHSSSWLAGKIKEFLVPFGITQKQFNILRILKGHKGDIPLSVLDVRNRMIDKMSDASRIIDRLHKKSLVKKTPCTKDKRANRVEITEAGLKVLDDIQNNMDQLDEMLFGLTQSEAVVMNMMLDKMRGEE